MHDRPLAHDELRGLTLADGCREENVPAFAPFSEAYAETSAIAPSTAAMGPDVHLLAQWELCSHVYLIRDGLVKLSYANENGTQVTLGLRSSGWYAGAASALLKMPSLYSVITVGNCTVSPIPAEQFFFWTTQNFKTLRHFMRSICLDSICQARLHAEISSSSAAERLEHFMQERITADQQGKTMDPLPLLKQVELAKLLAVTPEHLSRLRSRRTRCPARGALTDGRK